MTEPAPIKGLVLAGGRSTRMGTDKAALSLDGETLLARAVNLLSEFVDDVYVSVRPDQGEDSLRAAYKLIEDAWQDYGPAAGILSAHRQYPDCAWLVIACDMPLLDAGVVGSLIDARAADMDATVCLDAENSQPEPLCALYEPVTLAAFLQHVASGGNLSPRDWLKSRPVSSLQPDRPERLAGVNTQQEFERITGQALPGREADE